MTLLGELEKKLLDPDSQILFETKMKWALKPWEKYRGTLNTANNWKQKSTWFLLCDILGKRLYPHDLISSKDPPPNIITLEIKLEQMKFGGMQTSFHDRLP